NGAFFAGNACYWQVRLEGETQVCFKHRFREDPLFATERRHLTTTIWSDPIVGRPETRLTGVSFTRGGYSRVARSVPHGSGGYVLHPPQPRGVGGARLRPGGLLRPPRGRLGRAGRRRRPR